MDNLLGSEVCQSQAGRNEELAGECVATGPRWNPSEHNDEVAEVIPSAISGRGLVQGHGGANKSFQGLLVNLVAFAEVDGTPYSTLETGIEET